MKERDFLSDGGVDFLPDEGKGFTIRKRSGVP